MRRTRPIQFVCAIAVAAHAAADPPSVDMQPDPSPAAPQPAPDKLLRYDEDYSFLADPERRTEWLDGLKYISLSDSGPNCYLSIGGEIRERYEFFANPAFGLRHDGHDDYVLQRLLLHSDLHFDDHVRLFVQTISANQWGQDGATSPAQADDFDLQQAFGDVLFGDADRGVTLRAGRQEMSFGSSRLVAVREAPDVHFTHDGGRATLRYDGVTVDAFATRVVNTEKYQFDDWNSGQNLWGMYGTLPVDSWLSGIDLYYLGFRNENSTFNDRHGTQTRHSLGTRWFRSKDAFTFDVEAVGQVGDFGGDSIRAWTLATDFAYTFNGAPLEPRLGLKADVASGGPDHAGRTVTTFDPLLFKAGYFNDASLLRPSNLIDVHPTFELAPSKQTAVTLGYDLLWRYSTSDGLYDPRGAVQIPGSANSARFVGSSLEAGLEWRIDKHTTWTVSYVHLFAGQFIREARGKDVDFFGTWLDFKF